MKQDDIYARIQREKEEKDIALSYFGTEVTYQTLLEQAERCARAFWKQGIRQGDAVLICSVGTPETVYTLLGLWRIGACAHVLNPAAPPALLERRMRESGASLLMVLDQFLPRLRGICVGDFLRQIVILPVTDSMPTELRERTVPRLRVQEQGEDLLAWNAFLRHGGRGILPDADADFSALVLYSDGVPETRGGVELRQNALLELVQMYESRGFAYRRQERFLHIIPLCYAAGAVVSLLIPLCLGLTVILEPRFQPKAFAAALRYTVPQHVVASTSLWLSAMQYPDMQAADLSTLRSPYTGVAKESLSPETEALLNRFLLKQGCPLAIQKAYGLCELGGAVCCTTVHRNKPGSVGMALPTVRICAFTPETGARLPMGEIGELYVSTPCHMHGYFRNEAASHAFFYRDSYGTLWGKTGQQGYVDADGAVFLTDCPRKTEAVFAPER